MLVIHKLLFRWLALVTPSISELNFTAGEALY